MFYDGDWVEAYDVNFATPWKGQIAHNADGELIVIKENGDYRYFYNLHLKTSEFYAVKKK